MGIVKNKKLFTNKNKGSLFIFICAEMIKLRSVKKINQQITFQVCANTPYSIPIRVLLWYTTTSNILNFFQYKYIHLLYALRACVCVRTTKLNK